MIASVKLSKSQANVFHDNGVPQWTIQRPCYMGAALQKLTLEVANGSFHSATVGGWSHEYIWKITTLLTIILEM